MPTRTSHSHPHQHLRAVQPGTVPRSQPAARRPQGPADIRATKEYKLAARRWTSTIVALPIVLYTSYILYERVYGNKAPKKLGHSQEQTSSSAS